MIPKVFNLLHQGVVNRFLTSASNFNDVRHYCLTQEIQKYQKNVMKFIQADSHTVRTEQRGQ